MNSETNATIIDAQITDIKPKENSMKSLSDTLNSVKEDIKTTVKDTKVVEDITNAINAEKSKIKACYEELCKRGKQSAAYMFIAKCIENLKQYIHKLIGHIKELWARIIAMFSNNTVKA